MLSSSAAEMPSSSQPQGLRGWLRATSTPTAADGSAMSSGWTG